MADRKNFYYRQKVLEAELDGAFDGLEAADLALTLDQDLCARTPPADKSSYGGITSGFTVTHAGDLDFDITAGSAYDEQGRRAATASTLQLTVSNQGDTAIGAAGTPTGASAEPTLGNERWVTAYLVYDRLESDERYDGYNYPIYFERAESFHFNVVAGSEKAIGSLLDADKPARESGKLLVFDARIKNEAGTTVYVSHDVDRKEWFLNLTAANLPNLTIESKGNVRDAIKILLDHINDHVGGLTNLHPASVIETTITSLWADGVKGAYGLSTVLSDALNNLMEDLNSTTEPAGVKHLGAKAQAPGLTAPPPTQASPAELSAGTLEDQLTELLEAVNGRIFRGGDSGITGVLSPETDGTALGTTANSWDVLARDLTVKGDLRSDLKPVTDGMGNLGAPLRRFSDIYTNNLTIYDTLLLSAAKFSHVVDDAEAYAFEVKRSGGDRIISVDPTQVGIAGAWPIVINKPTVIDPGTPPFAGIDGLRINLPSSGLRESNPRLPLAFGSASVLTGGVNEWGAPIRASHFRDDFNYNVDRYSTIADLPMCYKGEIDSGGGIFPAEIASDKCPGTLILNAPGSSSNSSAALYGPKKLYANASSGFFWTFVAQFRLLNNVANTIFEIGLWSNDTNRHVFWSMAFNQSINWVFNYGNGSSYTPITTGVSALSGGVTKVVISCTSSGINAYAFNENSSFYDPDTYYNANLAGADAYWQPFASVGNGSASAVNARLFMDYWEWYNKAEPNLGARGIMNPVVP